MIHLVNNSVSIYIAYTPHYIAKYKEKGGKSLQVRISKIGRQEGRPI